MKKFLKWLLIIFVVGAVTSWFGRNFIARVAVSTGAEKMTGFPLEIGDIDVSPFSSKIDARNIKLKNSAEFPEPMFVDMPQIYVDYSLPSMVSGTPHIKEMTIDIKELIIVKNAKGETNAMKLKDITSSEESKTTYRVDTLHIKVGKVLYKTFSADGKVSTKEYSADIDVTYKDLTDATQISKLVLLTVMRKVKLPDIGIHMDDLKKGLGNVTNVAGKLLKEGGEILHDTGRGVLDTGKGTIDNIRRVLPGGGTKN